MTDSELLTKIYGLLVEVNDVVLDLQTRQIRTTRLVEEVEKKEAAEPQTGGYATGYQKEK